MGGLALAYVLVCAWGAASYRRFLYPVPRTHGLEVPRDAELWTLRADDGAEVHALHLPATGPLQRAEPHFLVFFHGNGETIGHDRFIGDELAKRGIDVVLAEYRGYGVSSASPSPTEAGLYLDASAVLDALTARGVPKERVTLWGASLGTGVATEMAHRGRAAALVLFTPYTSIPAVAARWVPGLPMTMIVRDRYDSLEKAKDVTMPTLIVHGTADGVVPYDMGVTLSHAFPHARLFTVLGGGHMDLLIRDPSLFDTVASVARGG